MVASTSRQTHPYPWPYDLKVPEKLSKTMPVVAPAMICVLPCASSRPNFPRRCPGFPLPPGTGIRYEWLVKPFSTGTPTPEEAPSFSWRTNAKMSDGGSHSLHRPVISYIFWSSSSTFSEIKIFIRVRD